MRVRFFWKLVFACLFLPLVMLMAVDFYAASVLRRAYVNAGFEQLGALMQLAHSRPPQVANPEELRAWTVWMARSGARVTVVAEDGRVLADSEGDASQMENHAGRPEIRDALADGAGRAIRFSDTVGRDLLYLAKREGLNSDDAFVVRLALPLARIQEHLSEIRRSLWAASLIVLLLAGGAALLISRRLSWRIDRLKLLARRVADGDFRPMAVERVGDELSELGRALNETAGRLDLSIRTLTDERNRSAAILRGMREGVLVVDAAQRVVFTNQAFCASLDVDPVASEGQPMVEVLRVPDLMLAAQSALGAQEIMQSEVALLVKGETRWFSLTSGPVRSSGASDAGETQGAVLVLHDITDLKKLERVRRDFVANVSHEFKTPLTAIRGFAETLLSGALEDAANRRRFVTIIRDQTEKLSRMTDDLLTLSRIEAEEAEPIEQKRQPVSVAELIESCVETARLRAEQKGIMLAATVPPDLPPVLGDADQLAEVLLNLLDNAVQYTPAGGSIIARAASDGGGAVRISVSDTGIGIPQDEIPRIFERFYRVDPARSREQGGTGLGLSICKHVVEAHGGRLEVQSDVGHGSTFTVVLPAL